MAIFPCHFPYSPQKMGVCMQSRSPIIFVINHLWKDDIVLPDCNHSTSSFMRCEVNRSYFSLKRRVALSSFFNNLNYLVFPLEQSFNLTFLGILIAALPIFFIVLICIFTTVCPKYFSGNP